MGKSPRRPSPATPPRRPSVPTLSQRSLSGAETKVTIHVYDLLQLGKLSSFLWHIGGGLLHSGVVIGEKEYAYGGHDEREVSGVYWNHPRTEPPGCTFRAEILHGFTSLDSKEIDKVVQDVSRDFLGTDWNLLTRNCNHFTSYLCEQLTGKPAPVWLNRAANIGISMPVCMIPREFLSITVPEADDAEALLNEQGAADEDEHRVLLRTSRNGVDPKLSRITSWYDDGDDGSECGSDSEDRSPTPRPTRSPTPARSSRTPTPEGLASVSRIGHRDIRRHTRAMDACGMILPESVRALV